MNLKGTKKKNQVSNVNIFEQQEFLKKIEVVRENLTASTWHELETKGKFDKNAKLSVQPGRIPAGATEDDAGVGRLFGRSESDGITA